MLGVRGMSDPRCWALLWRFLRAERPDLIVAVNQSTAIASALVRLAGATHAKLACILHTTELRPAERHQQALFVRLTPLLDLLVCVGTNQLAVWEGRGTRPRRTVVIRNGVDLARFSAAPSQRCAVRARFGVGGDEYLLGILAAFRPEKNHGELVSALAAVGRLGLRPRLMCIGGGPTRAEVERRAVELGVAEQLVFVGEQAEVAAFVGACDVGVLCSRIETFPLSAIEMLASGAPMICSRVGGAAEIVEHDRNGRLYRSGDVDGLAAAICDLAQPETRKRLAEQARPSVAAFAAERMVDAYVEAFDALF